MLVSYLACNPQGPKLGSLELLSVGGFGEGELQRRAISICATLLPIGLGED